ncbi:hypothetical protein [Pseudaestuariivita rosea]|uniref:hypothetical protein n=1 Tax=Pseudaestuariivita rosea TaxID=2763263 RepID=UPI001ABA8CA9|nr:hypothetical protein [Pseudaestuariivita rosea]
MYFNIPAGAIFVSLLVWAIIFVPPHIQYWKRTGHSPYLGLLVVIPVVGLISVWVLALKEWPSEHGREK